MRITLLISLDSTSDFNHPFCITICNSGLLSYWMVSCGSRRCWREKNRWCVIGWYPVDPAVAGVKRIAGVRVSVFRSQWVSRVPKDCITCQKCRQCCYVPKVPWVFKYPVSSFKYQVSSVLWVPVSHQFPVFTKLRLHLYLHVYLTLVSTPSFTELYFQYLQCFQFHRFQYFHRLLLSYLTLPFVLHLFNRPNRTFQQCFYGLKFSVNSVLRTQFMDYFYGQ